MQWRPTIRALGSSTVLVGACLIVCLALGPTWREAYDLVCAPQDFIRRSGADHAVLVIMGLALWVFCGWLTVAVGCWAGATLPGRSGRTFGRLGRLVSPRLVPRALGVAIGISLGTPVAQNATASPPDYSIVAVAGLAQDTTASPLTAGMDWPAEPAASQSTATVAVHPGDCLWSLAEAHLGYGATTAEISEEVDRWWAANAEVIGADPDLLIPGQVLVIPST